MGESKWKINALHTFQTKPNIHRELKTKLMVRLEVIYPAEERTLIIARSASNEPS